MIVSERQNQICSILSEQRFATVKELSERLFISESSIRRDLSRLESKGYIKRNHGGAILLHSGDTVVPFGIRTFHNVKEKKLIAKKAVELIHTGDMVFLDQTSTSYFLAAEILKSKTVTVVTNNREIINLLAGSELPVICSGGIISKANDICLIGQSAQDTFSEIYADIAFFSCKSLSFDGIISDCSQEEVFVRNAMLASAAKKVFLCDGSKMGSRSAYKQCELNDVDVLVSETTPSRNFLTKAPSLLLL